ncbi:chaperonin 10-like protein [Crepidotus variabilis]|uniref:Chaperonin 10-like protein n=1 Tax=Crepidotus variabilis TaxID=179855 RepID=A0A9P6JQR3_9AGAR|nr:chaperonin 10-like protein [Crepidotus variabilis]
MCNPVFPALRLPFELRRDHPIPSPERGEIRLKIHSVSLNPADEKIQRGDFDHWLDGKLAGVISGLDIAGEVDELGKDVSTFFKGDRVFLVGTFLQSKKLGLDLLLDCGGTPRQSSRYKIPAGASYDDAIAIPTGLTAAYVGLYNHHPHGLGFSPPTNTF